MATNKDQLNRVRYAGLDFNSAVDEVLSRMQVEFATLYTDFSVASIGMMIVDLFAFTVDTMSFYLDRRATDMYLTTARTRKSVARTARQIGYKMAPATAASVDIQVAPAIAQTFAVPLTYGFQLRAPDGAIWESSAAYTWPTGNTTVQTITFSQTETDQAIFTSNGDRNQVFTITGIPDGEYLVGPGTDGVSQITCEVNGQDWTESELLQFGATNQFEIGYNDDPPTCRFGDSVAGNIPPAGAQIRLTYKTSRGPAGQVTKGQTMTPVKPLVANFQNITLSLTVPSGSSGGSAPESISKAKANAPSVFKARGVNITKEDYQARATSFADSVYGAVAVASVVNVKSAATDAALQSLVEEVGAVSQTYVSTVDSSATTASASAATAKTNITSAQTAIASLTSILNALKSGASTASDTNKSVSTAVGVANSFVADITNDAATLSTTIGGIATAGTDGLQSATKTTILSLINSIVAAANTALSQTSTAAADTGTLATSLLSMGSSATDGLANITTVTTSATAAGTAIDAAVSGITAMTEAVAVVDNNIDDLGQQIVDHVGSFLSSDCQSNLIEVPVLSFDADGFYVAPTIALTKSLQRYLDANKGVTQVVKVVPGGTLLVPAEIMIHVGVLQGYVESTVRSQVESAVLGRLKKRAFGKSLDISELYWVISPERGVILGLDFANITITGPADMIDSNGNLVVQSNQVVTRGVLTITSEVVPSN